MQRKMLANVYLVLQVQPRMRVSVANKLTGTHTLADASQHPGATGCGRALCGAGEEPQHLAVL